MGQLRFIAPLRDRLPAGAEGDAYLTGMESVPFPSRNLWDGDQLVIVRDVRESGNLNILWDVPERGPLVLATASLLERPRPYLLPVELARGTLHRLRNQLSVWQAMGLAIPASFVALEREAMLAFGRAATHQSDAALASAAADSAIVCALEAGSTLATAYVEQVLALRHEQAGPLATILGAALPARPLDELESRQFQQSFNAATIPVCWHDIEPSEGEYDWSSVDRHFQWLKGTNLKVCAGPLLRFAPDMLPDWLYLWEDDFESIQGYVQQFLAAIAQRYRGAVHLWHCTAGLNMPGELALTEEQKLRLAVLAIDTVRRADPRTPVIVSFDQPWGEYLRLDEMDLPPYHFADALIRADLGLAGVGVEINLGYAPGGTLPRDVLEVSRLVDRWSSLGVPLVNFMTAPSQTGADPLARLSAATVDPTTTPARAAAGLSPWLAMLLAKQSTHGVFWNQWSDADPHVWPHGGLLDTTGAPKPLLDLLAQLKAQHLS